MGSAREIDGFLIPAGDVVQHTARLAEDVGAISFLVLGKVGVADEGRVADYKIDLARGNGVVPVHTEGVRTGDSLVVAERQLLVDALGHLSRVDVGLFLCDPESCTRNTTGEVFELYAMEVLEGN